MKSAEKLLQFIQKNGPSSIDELSIFSNFSRQYIHRLINKMVEGGELLKMGQAPKVFYSTTPLEDDVNSNKVIPYQTELFLQEHFLLIDALGTKKEGLEAMSYWCQNQNLPLSKTIDEFISTRNKYLSHYNKEHLIDGLSKLKHTSGLGLIGMDELYYLDYYTIERFGKTRLGTLMHYAKQGQNKNLIKIIASEIKNRLHNLIISKEIDAIAYIPPTIQRKIQFITELEKQINFDLPKLTISKISNEIVIPQKALSKLFERVLNAQNTFVIPNQKKYNRVLLIDDAVGSGATMNEISKKLKAKKIARHIIGIAITGSYKGFEVLSEL
ncbi:MAG: hypothetical protein ABI851_14365 [Saprospiraceae bacterium]